MCESLSEFKMVQRRGAKSFHMKIRGRGGWKARKFDNEKCRDALRPLKHVSRCQIVIFINVANCRLKQFPGS